MIARITCPRRMCPCCQFSGDLFSAPDANAGEITDKGYIAQALARSLRAEAVERLFAEPADAEVIVLS